MINPGQTCDYTSPECNRRSGEERRVIEADILEHGGHRRKGVHWILFKDNHRAIVRRSNDLTRSLGFMSGKRAKHWC